jgi:hypothetical protein
MKTSAIFEQNYDNYCDQLARVDFGKVKFILDIDHNEVLFWGKKYIVSGDGIKDEHGKQASYSVAIVIAQYILRCPDELHLSKQWVSFKDFTSDAYAGTELFMSKPENNAKTLFTGRADALKKACEAYGGKPHDIDVPYDIAYRFDILPRISVLLLFNDADEDFPAQCKTLFLKHTEHYIDPESLVIALGYLIHHLYKSVQKLIKEKPFD